MLEHATQTTLDLRKFCSREPTREYLHAPFSVGNFTYATDGRILVRVPRRDDAPEQTHKARWDAPLNGADTASYKPMRGTLPDIGKVPCVYCFDGHKHECPDCECPCDECRGSGEVFEKVSTEIDGISFDARYMRMVLELPNVEIARPVPEIAESSATQKPLLFRFDGGVGALMPMCGQHLRHVQIKKGES